MTLFLLSCCLNLLVSQPEGSTIDRKVDIRVERLAPFQEVELVAETEDQQGTIWVSHAGFRADEEGRVDVSLAAPLDNASYQGVDAMGLFWSMRPSAGGSDVSFKSKDDLISFDIKLYIDGSLLAQETVERYIKSAEVKRIAVNEEGLVGALFLTESKRPLPLIITLSGSNGGLSENRAKLLASNGFNVLALGYFGVDGLPANLQDIPLEYFEGAFRWLKTQPDIDASRVGLYGVSRGAELALLLGSFFPDSVQAIVAVAPSSVVHGGLNVEDSNAWICQGKPVLPLAPVGAVNHSDNPICTRQSFIEGMKDTEAFARASIPVEKIRCPILLVSGGEDQVWPSDLYAKEIDERLERFHSPISCRHLYYPKAGHGINIPNLPFPEPIYYHPVGKVWLSMGGARAEDARASADSWDKLVKFFQEALKCRAEMECEAYIVRAFCREGQGGNLAGVVLDQELTSEQMQAVAKELNFLETIFLTQRGDDSYKSLYFTPTSPIDFCGHATIAAFGSLGLEDGVYQLDAPIGPCEVTVRGSLIFLSQAAPVYGQTISEEEVRAVLGGVSLGKLKPQVVSTGLTDIFVEVESKEALFAISPDHDAITKLCEKYDAIGMHVFSLEPEGAVASAYCRNFAPRYGIPEESATGSSSGALGCYLFHHGKVRTIGQHTLLFKQGDSMNSPSDIYVRLLVTDEGVEKVECGGTAVVDEVRKITS